MKIDGISVIVHGQTKEGFFTLDVLNDNLAYFKTPHPGSNDIPIIDIQDRIRNEIFRCPVNVSYSDKRCLTHQDILNIISFVTNMTKDEVPTPHLRNHVNAMQIVLKGLLERLKYEDELANHLLNQAGL